MSDERIQTPSSKNVNITHNATDPRLRTRAAQRALREASNDETPRRRLVFQGTPIPTQQEQNNDLTGIEPLPVDTIELLDDTLRADDHKTLDETIRPNEVQIIDLSVRTK